ncbi:EAL domain-containing protein [Robertmurraya korlensis]|uniref:EAL domain-containing protein n=1 Tax=Robertmurraya korlensis TaxID=519977 RepID=UPI00082701BB|nr:EAL domain-containing protein [Robertmurraya korlensis]
MKKCTECGVSYKINTSGYLFIEGMNNDRTYTEYKYSSIQELEDYLKTLTRELKDLSEVKAAVSNEAEKPIVLTSLPVLLERVKNREIVQVIQTGELIGHIQPIIDLQNNQLFAFESLLRTNGMNQIPPGQLFQVAEKTGLLSMLDQRAREVAIQTRRKYIKKGVKSFINFLPSTIYNPEFCLQHTFHLVNRYGIDPTDLVFEVVETEKIDDVEHLQKVFITYKKQGMKVALDDVGSGFSTIEMLELLHPDYVKIDRSYIDHCDQDRQKQKFLKEVQLIAQDLNIQVLAEGIERIEELELCRDLGMNLAQGYFVGKPKTGDQYINLQI